MKLRHEMDALEYAADMAREFGCTEIAVDPAAAGGPILLMTLRRTGQTWRRYMPDRFIGPRSEG